MFLFRIWFTIFALGFIFYPIAYQIFKNFKNRGWFFSKVLGTCFFAWIMWLLSYLKILVYSRLNSILIILFVFLFEILFIFIKYYKKHYNEYKNMKELLLLQIKKIKNSSLIQNIILSECIFILCLCFWVHIKGYNSSINSSTEQFMDYGYMNSIMNTKYMPPEDIWLSSNPINYYYFGQYISGFICKIADITAADGYFYIISLIASFSFILPFSIGYNLFYNMFKAKKGKILTIILPIVVAGFIGISTSLRGYSALSNLQIYRS